jgi:hypothetical protein
MTESLASLRTSIGKWIREGVDDLMVNDAINDAIQDLYSGLLTVDAGNYLSQEPTRFIGDGSDDALPIPFQEQMGCIPFIRYTALSLLGESAYEDESSLGWDNRAQRARERVLLEALNKTDRQETVEVFDPYRQTGLMPNRQP